MFKNKRYWGILFMLISTITLALMGGTAKYLKNTFNAGQLVFFRNAVGIIYLSFSFIHRPPKIKLGKSFFWLIFRGMMGTSALYMLLYSILHVPLGTAITYNLTSTIFIALFSFFIFKEIHSKYVWLAIVAGFVGILFVFKPSLAIGWQYHLIGLLSGIASSFSYLTICRIAKYYEPRVIVMSFIACGFFAPIIFSLIRFVFNLPADSAIFIVMKLPQNIEWLYTILLGSFALATQVFLTKAYSIENASVVASVNFASIIFSVIVGVILGDALPDKYSVIGMLLIIVSGVLIAYYKRIQKVEVE